MPVYYQQNGALMERPTAEPYNSAREFLQPLVRQWLDLAEQAQKSKEPFNMIAYQCDSFFSKQSGFMWKEQYRNEYIGPGIQPPKFMVTINKAFELVALFGPYLFWKYPQVFIQTPEPLEIEPELFGDVESDPQAAMAYQQYQADRRFGDSRTRLRNSMMQKYLNYSQREQPGGGLKTHVEVAITEALVKGRSCLWIEGYNPPGSDRNLTQSKWRTVDDLLIDPDSRDPFLEDAKFIMLIHDDSAVDVERKFQLPRGYLRGKGDYASKGSQSKYSFRAARDKSGHRDRKIWYEIWSRGGVGNQLTGEDRADQIVSPALLNAFDDVVGDYAYLCVTEDVPFPLNAPSRLFRDEYGTPQADDDEVRAMFQWRAPDYGPPFPCHLDGRWPVALVEFYRTYSSCWPIAPLAPALGELTILNILAATFTEQSYENRKRIIAYLESAAKDVKAALTSTDSTVMIPLNDIAQKSIADVIQFLDRPEANTDLREAIPFIERLFEQRTGLNEFLYAMQSTQDRTARGVAAKEEKASIRPEKMSQDVAHWLTQRAELEKFLAGWTVRGSDVEPLLGRYGAHFWDELIANEDPEITVREMRCTVEANDHRKPNQQRLLDNMQQSLQFLLPILQQYAVDTGDSGPINEFLASMNKAMEDKIMPQLGPWRPQPDDQQAQAQQIQDELEQAKLQAEVQGKQLDVQKAQVELQATVNTTGIEAQQKQLELAYADQSHNQDLLHSDEKHEQELTQDQEKFVQDIQQQRAEQALKLQAARMQTADKIVASREQADIKTQQAKAQAKAKPKARK